MKFQLEDSVKALIGKTFQSSEFRTDNDSCCDTFGNEVKLEDFDPKGKTILNAFIANCCGDIGVGLKFEGYPNPLFFYVNEEIVVD